MGADRAHEEEHQTRRGGPSDRRPHQTGQEAERTGTFRRADQALLSASRRSSCHIDGVLTVVEIVTVALVSGDSASFSR